MSFKGRMPINWIMSLNKLKMLTLNHFLKCKIMPPIGKLSSLEILRMWSMKNVKRVGDEFLRTKISDHIHIHGTSSSSSSIIAFPRLKELELCSMEELESWKRRCYNHATNKLLVHYLLQEIEIAARLTSSEHNTRVTAVLRIFYNSHKVNKP